MSFFRASQARGDQRRVDMMVGEGQEVALCQAGWVEDGVVRGARGRRGRYLITTHPPWEPRTASISLDPEIPENLDPRHKNPLCHLPPALDHQDLTVHRLAADLEQEHPHHHHHGQDGAAAHGQRLLHHLLWQRGPCTLQRLTSGNSQMRIRSICFKSRRHLSCYEKGTCEAKYWNFSQSSGCGWLWVS